MQCLHVKIKNFENKKICQTCGKKIEFNNCIRNGIVYILLKPTNGYFET